MEDVKHPRIGDDAKEDDDVRRVLKLHMQGGFFKQWKRKKFSAADCQQLITINIARTGN